MHAKLGNNNNAALLFSFTTKRTAISGASPPSSTGSIILRYARFTHFTLSKPSDMNPGHVSRCRFIIFSMSVLPKADKSTKVVFVKPSTITHDSTTTGDRISTDVRSDGSGAPIDKILLFIHIDDRSCTKKLIVFG
uniref:Putative ovule protein n=1 Tax=Solanum chacoense TaxID=4108 RepID=A0A0V0H9C0_SOLCH